jgi:uncharacterized membrane protein
MSEGLSIFGEVCIGIIDKLNRRMRRTTAVTKGWTDVSGEMIAVFSAVLYALSYLFLHQGQVQAQWRDNGLFPVLFIGTIALGSVFLLRGGTTGFWGEITQSELLFAALSGLIGTLFGRLALFFAVARLGATRGVVVKSFAPLITLLFAAVFLHESWTTSDMYGTFLLLLSIVFLFIERLWIPNLHRSLAFLQKGVVVAAIAALCQGIGHGMRKLAVQHTSDALTCATVDISTALVIYLLLLLLTGRLRDTLASYRHSRNSFIWAAGLTSAAATLLFFLSVTRANVSVVAAIAGTEPILVGLFSLLLFPKLEKLNLWTISSSILVAFGVILFSA